MNLKNLKEQMHKAMNQKSLKCFLSIALLLIAVLRLLDSSTVLGVEQISLDDVEQEVIRAFLLLREGLQEGGDMNKAKDIENDINRAIDLVDVLKYSSALNLSNQDEMNILRESLILARKARENAEAFLTESKQRRVLISLATWTLVPVASLAFAMLVLGLHSWYVNRRKKLMRRMIIRIKEKPKKEA